MEQRKNFIISLQKHLSNKNERDPKDWCTTFYAHLEKELETKKGSKDYQWYESLTRHVANCIFAFVFPLALAKRAITGTYFFSLEGKTQDAVKIAVEVVKEEQRKITR